MLTTCRVFLFFFFNDTATTEIYTLSLHDALPIFDVFVDGALAVTASVNTIVLALPFGAHADRKSTRLNSSHSQISYAVFCLKKKKTKTPKNKDYKIHSNYRYTNRIRTDETLHNV